MSAFMRRTGSLVAAAALLAVSTPVWASAPAARNAPAAAPAVQAAPVSELVREVDIPYTCLLYTSRAHET